MLFRVVPESNLALDRDFVNGDMEKRLTTAADDKQIVDQPADGSRTVDRNTLYREVWERPMTSVAVRYGVSSSFLARVCARLNVPRPPRGYWAKVEFGGAPEKPDLPAPRPGDVLEWSRDGSLPRVAKGATVAPRDTKRGSSARPLR